MLILDFLLTEILYTSCTIFLKSLPLRWYQILREKCSYSELFWSAFSRIQTEYGEILRISLYSVRMRGNAVQNNSEYGHVLRSESENPKIFIFQPNFFIFCTYHHYTHIHTHTHTHTQNRKKKIFLVGVYILGPNGSKINQKRCAKYLKIY